MMAEHDAAKYARRRRPNGITPIDLEDAAGMAARCKISRTLFLRLVEEGHLPKPVTFPGHRIARWIVADVARALRKLAGAEMGVESDESATQSEGEDDWGEPKL